MKVLCVFVVWGFGGLIAADDPQVDTQEGMKSFIENVVLSALPDPVGDLVNTVRAAPPVVKEGLRSWLRSKMLEAGSREDWVAHDRYYAFYLCLTVDNCSELKKLQASVGGADLLGSWVGCDGRVVTFTQEGGQYIGRYTALGGLGTYHFTPNEIGYKATQAADGTYVGQVKWRYTNGDHQWRPLKITIKGNQYSDEGSDGCSKNMKRR